MAGLNISEVLEALRNCQNPEEFDGAARRLERQCESFQGKDKVKYWCFLAAIKLDKLRDAEGSMELLKRALKQHHITAEQKIEVLARMASNRIAVAQYSNGLSFHKQAVDLCESNYPEGIHTIMGVYLKQCSFDTECAEVSQILSYLYEINGQIDQAIKQEKKALAFYTAEGVRSAHMKKFSEWRLATLKTALPSTTSNQSAEFEQKNRALRLLFEFYPLDTVERSIDELQNEKDLVLQKLRRTYLKYNRQNRPELRQKLDKLKQLITELNTSDFPLAMHGEVARLKEQDEGDRPVIPPLALGGTPGPRVSFGETRSVYRKPIIQSTTSRVFGIAQSSNPNWQGSNLVKMHFGSEGEEERYFYLKSGKERLYYCKNKKDKSKDDDYYDLKELQAVKVGKMTKTMRKKEHDEKDQSLCFSLELKDRTRDFVALNQEDLAMWVDRLRQMISFRDQKQGGKKLESGASTKPLPPRISSTMPSLPMQLSSPPSEVMRSGEMQQSQPGNGTLLLSKKR